MISHDVLVCLNLNGLINAFVLALIFFVVTKKSTFKSEIDFLTNVIRVFLDLWVFRSDS